MTLLEHPIIKQLEEAKALIARSQPMLLNLVQDKQHDVSDRFEVWSTHVDKEDHDAWFHFCTEQEKPNRAGRYPKTAVPELLHNWDDCVEDRHSVHTWDEIYEGITDHYYYDIRKKKGNSMTDIDDDQEIKDVKEWFIQENFGSFTADW